MKTSLLIFVALSAFVISGCSIKTNAVPVPPGTVVSTIHVQRNPNVHMEGLHDEVITQLRGLGHDAVGFDGDRPDEARFMMTYTANWRWDMAMYLTYFEATLLDGNKILGTAKYDATHGSWRMDKFGKSAEKIKPLLIELLQNAEKPTAPPMAMGHN